MNLRTPPETLYHFTCRHGAERIEADGCLKPGLHPLLAYAPAVIWLTDLPARNLRQQMGLTSHTLTCDRTEVRYAVQGEGGYWWPNFAHSYSFPLEVRHVLEDGRWPAHWWVSERPIPIRAVAA